jgi:hypothetical protein
MYDEDVGTLFRHRRPAAARHPAVLGLRIARPAIAPDIASPLPDAVKAFAPRLLYSAMIDPLDGGVYSSRRGNRGTFR